MNTPDPKWHLRISLVKSMLRIGAGAFIINNKFFVGGSLLIAAEVLGILEEII